MLNRKNALFAGHDEGAENWALIASLIETCKLNDVDPQAYFADVLVKLVNLWPASRIDELMPWPGAPPIGSWRFTHVLHESLFFSATGRAVRPARPRPADSLIEGLPAQQQPSPETARGRDQEDRERIPSRHE